MQTENNNLVSSLFLYAKRLIFIFAINQFVFFDIIAQEFSYTKVNSLMDSIKNLATDSAKIKVGTALFEYCISNFKKPVTFNDSLSEVYKIGKIYSPDKKFRFYTWNIVLTDGTYKYYGIIQFNPGKDSICKIIELKDTSRNYKGKTVFEKFDKERWFGALYYEIVQKKVEGKRVYTLLGLHLKDLFSTERIIESLFFDEKGDPQFGLPIFDYGLKMQSRVIFEYSINVTMGLKFDEKLQMIVFDHLSPQSPLYSGNFKFYGPDFSYDGLKFEKDKWVYYPNLNLHR